MIRVCPIKCKQFCSHEIEYIKIYYNVLLYILHTIIHIIILYIYKYCFSYHIFYVLYIIQVHICMIYYRFRKNYNFCSTI